MYSIKKTVRNSLLKYYIDLNNCKNIKKGMYKRMGNNNLTELENLLSKIVDLLSLKNTKEYGILYLIILIIIYIITYLSAYLTCRGMPLSKLIAKFMDFKNRKSVENIILYRTTDEKFKEIIIKLLRTLLEFAIFIIAICVIGAIMGAFLYLAKLFDNIQNETDIKKGDLCAYISMISMLIGILFAHVGGKHKHSRKYIVNVILVILSLCFGELIMISSGEVEFKLILCIISFVYIGIMSTIVCIFSMCGIYQVYKRNKKLQISRRMRYIALAVFTIQIIVRLEFNKEFLNVLLILWITVSFLEYVYINRHAKDRYVEFCLDIYNNQTDKTSQIERTSNRIMQYSREKIKYVVEGNMVKIVDASLVNKISFQIKNIPKGRFGDKMNKKSEITCFFKDNTKKKFQKYFYIGESWIQFSNEENGVKDVSIYNVDKISKIIVKQS